MTSSVELPELPQDDLPRLFDGSMPAGVYRLPSVGPDALMQADAAGWVDAVVDLAGATGKEDFMDRCVAGLELPGYFGRNWDALADLLTDLSWWGEGRGYLVLMTSWTDFEAAVPREADAAAEVFTAAVGFWSVRDTPLAVLLG
ncbi:barstar family protein [Streptomyces boncukensis]|uniref:Barstar family protein n=1 Tax=Streptomyces boncukensis TaxID=2711219 RepID=A0A6G4XA58_9ACTN|nr:barstar family protein [Streptomyces boncukensis]NGO73634.1 barstar family protein [Streptomyces boncukensis]